MRNMLTSAGAVLVFMACSGGESGEPPIATGVVTGGTSAEGTGGAVSTGGTSSAFPATGGTAGGASASTGGTSTGVATGGQVVVSTGGQIVVATGGVQSTGGQTVVVQTGGTTTVATGGTTVVATTGGTTSVGTGGVATVTGGTTSTTGTGGTAASTGGSTGTTTSTIPFTVDAGGFATSASGVWSGYAWTGSSEASITPSDFEAAAAGDSLCVSGTVSATTDYSGVAMLGWNIGQTSEGEDPPPGVAITTPIVVSYTNTGGSSLRVQIQTADGESNGDERWCAALPATSGTVSVPLADFNTTCWDNDGNAYAGELITAIIVMVPGGASDDIAFDFCVLGIDAG